MRLILGKRRRSQQGLAVAVENQLSCHGKLRASGDANFFCKESVWESPPVNSDSSRVNLTQPVHSGEPRKRQRLEILRVYSQSKDQNNHKRLDVKISPRKILCCVKRFRKDALYKPILRRFRNLFRNFLEREHGLQKWSEYGDKTKCVVHLWEIMTDLKMPAGLFNKRSLHAIAVLVFPKFNELI